jgi:hypothetical protein
LPAGINETPATNIAARFQIVIGHPVVNELPGSGVEVLLVWFICNKSTIERSVFQKLGGSRLRPIRFGGFDPVGFPAMPQFVTAPNVDDPLGSIDGTAVRRAPRDVQPGDEHQGRSRLRGLKVEFEGLHQSHHEQLSRLPRWITRSCRAYGRSVA